MFCPVCRAEYREGFTRCSSCEAELIDALPQVETPASSAPTASTYSLAYVLPVAFCIYFLFFVWTLRNGKPHQSVVIPFVFLTAVSNFGSLWMIYQSVRHEEKPVRYILWAMVPFSSFWYWSSRVVNWAPAAVPVPSAAPKRRPVHFLAYALPMAILYGLLLLLLFFPVPVVSPVLLLPLIVFAQVAPFGGLWMTYQAIRYEEKPLLYILLAQLPYAFVWYYMSRCGDGAVDREPVALRNVMPNS
jgi:hypothetical protein